MSMQGLQRAQQLLNVIGQQFPSIAQASETRNLDLGNFLQGMLARSGVVAPSQFVAALLDVIGPPTEPPTTGA